MLADKAGISQSHLRRVELGESRITVDHLEMICDALNISLKDFLILPILITISQRNYQTYLQSKNNF